MTSFFLIVGPLETVALGKGVLVRTIVLLRDIATVLLLNKLEGRLEGKPGTSAVSDRVRREVKGGLGREMVFMRSIGAFVVLERSRVGCLMESIGSMPSIS